MRFSQLYEGATDVLYHVTNVHASGSILKGKRFALTSSVGTNAERLFQKKSKFYYLSTARSKVADYTLHNTYDNSVVFNLDGRWFGQRYKTTPVDFWEQGWVQSRKAGAEDRYSEMEDRILSDKPYIEMPDISKAILEIHILLKDFDTKPDLDERFIQGLRTTLIEAKRAGIPVFIYADKKSMILQNKSKTIDSKTLIPLLKVEPRKSWGGVNRDWLKPYRELYHQKDDQNLSSEGKRLLYDIRYGDYMGDVLRSLAANLHNAKSNERQRDSLRKLLAIFKKEKISTPKEFLELLKAKWIKDN